MRTAPRWEDHTQGTGGSVMCQRAAGSWDGSAWAWGQSCTGEQPREQRGPSSGCGNSVVGFEFENCHLDSPSSERADLGQCLPATPPPAPAHSRPLRAHRLLPWEGSTHPGGTESSRPPDRERPGRAEHGAHAAPTRHVLRRHRATGSALRTQLRAADCVMRAHGHVSGSPGMECLAQHFLSHARHTRDLAVPGVGQHACAGRGAKTPRRVAACARGARGGPTRTPAGS